MNECRPTTRAVSSTSTARFVFQAEDGIRDYKVTGVQTCALPILARGLLQIGGWRNRPAREAARKIARFMMGGEPEQPQLSAMREELMNRDKVRLVLAGRSEERRGGKEWRSRWAPDH